MVDEDRDYNTIPPDGRPPLEQPEWRQDFPIDVPQDNYISRREFTKFLVLISAAFTVGQGWIVYENWQRKRAGKLPRMKVATLDKIPVGGSLVFFYPKEDEPCVLVRPEANKLLAFGQKCTHLSCAVIPEVKEKVFACPCHHGYFAMDDGRVLAGPPPRPLPRVKLEIHGNDIYATDMELRTVV